MSQTPQKINNKLIEKQKKSFALGQDDMVEFHHYTRKVWSKLAGRLLTDDEVSQIIENFGRFLDILSNRKVENEKN